MQDRFLDELLADLEADRARSVEDYEARYPELGAFVRAEVEALSGDAPSAPEAPPAAGRFVRERLLAEGGVAEVWLGRDSVLDRKVVLKQLRIELLGNGNGHARLLREARVLSRIEHPGLARVLDVVDDQGRLTLVLPWVEGRTLAEELAAAPPSGREVFRPSAQVGSGTWTGHARRDDPRPAVRLVEQIARAMQVAHEQGVVHRDLKPQNLVIQPDGSPVVIDFGLAWELESEGARLTLAGDAVGTPLYMAPEQVEGKTVDRRTDVFALGVVLYELLTGSTPFAADSRQETFARIVRGAFPAPRRQNPAISRDLEAVCLKALEREPQDRYASMGEFADELRRVLELRSPQAARRSAVTRVARRMVRSRMVWVVGTGACILVVLAWMLRAEVQRRARFVAGRDLEHGVHERQAAGFTMEDLLEAFESDPILGPLLEGVTTFEEALDVARGLLEQNRGDADDQPVALILPRGICPTSRPVFYVDCLRVVPEGQLALKLENQTSGEVHRLNNPSPAVQLWHDGLEAADKRRRASLPAGVALPAGSRWNVIAEVGVSAEEVQLGKLEVLVVEGSKQAAIAAWREIHEGSVQAGLSRLEEAARQGQPGACRLLLQVLVALGDPEWVRRRGR